MKLEARNTVVLFGCTVWMNANQTQEMSGLFTLEEWVPRDPSAYQWESGWLIWPEDFELNQRINDWVERDNEPPTFFVSDGDLFPQVDPHGYGEMLRMEREMEFAEEILNA